MATKLLALCIAGALGTLARYGLQGLVQRWTGGSFPWGTLAVNVLGCLAFGVIWTVASDRQLIGPQMRTLLLVGFMGAFTTFSSFVFETAQLGRGGQWLLAGANLGLELLLGAVALFAGIALGRLI
jgi:fluoride exporter